MTDINEPRRVWRASRRYDYYAIDEYRPHEGTGTYGDPIVITGSRRLADQVAARLNEAYAAGLADGRKDPPA